MSSSRNDGQWSRDNSTSNVSAGSTASHRLSGPASVLRGKNKATPRNSQSSSTERRSATFFRNFFAQRNTDYRAASVPSPPQYSQGSTPRTTAVRRPSSGRSSPPLEQSDEERSSRTRTDCCRPSPAFLHVLSAIIGSRIWRFIIVFNTILLLFGSEIQELWIPPGGDIVMDILYCIALAVFTMDMVMRCFLEPKYVTVPRCRNKENAQNKAWGRCQLGSFLFWCDLFSTLTLLYNISFINTAAFAISTIDITLNSIGIPVSLRECYTLVFLLQTHILFLLD